MDRHDFISGLFWLGISIFAGIMATDLSAGTFSSPGPGFLIFWSSLGLGVLSVILIFESIIGKRESKLLIDLWKGLKWRNAVLAILIVLLYGFLLPRLGFILATFLLMILLFALGKPRYWVVIVSALITVLLSYILFYYLLQIQFPRGIFGW